ncbi:hypothetical protein BT69DRAFT_1277210 [Atractiella rhizophila]|nr:hypothetical protein BT69DRAFT_1277210 [Atractiella rhizophila]
MLLQFILLCLNLSRFRRAHIDFSQFGLDPTPSQTRFTQDTLSHFRVLQWKESNFLACFPASLQRDRHDPQIVSREIVGTSPTEPKCCCSTVSLGGCDHVFATHDEHCTQRSGHGVAS